MGIKFRPNLMQLGNRDLPSITVLAPTTITLDNGSGATASAVVSVTQDEYTGIYQWEYDVTAPSGGVDTRWSQFYISVDDGIDVENLSGTWPGTYTSNPGGGATIDFEDITQPLDPGQTGVFTFTTPAVDITNDLGALVDTSPMGSSAMGTLPAPTPVAAKPSVKFTDGPKAVPNVGGAVAMDFRWDNCTGAAKVQITVVDNANPKISYGSDSFATAQVSGSKKNQQIFSTAPAGTKVKVTISVLDAQGKVIAQVSDTVIVN